MLLCQFAKIVKLVVAAAGRESVALEHNYCKKRLLLAAEVQKRIYLYKRNENGTQKNGYSYIMYLNSPDTELFLLEIGFLFCFF